jgi:hypothetical protein
MPHAASRSNPPTHPPLGKAPHGTTWHYMAHSDMLPAALPWPSQTRVEQVSGAIPMDFLERNFTNAYANLTLVHLWVAPAAAQQVPGLLLSAHYDSPGYSPGGCAAMARGCAHAACCMLQCWALHAACYVCVVHLRPQPAAPLHVMHLRPQPGAPLHVVHLSQQPRCTARNLLVGDSEHADCASDNPPCTLSHGHGPCHSSKVPGAVCWLTHARI